MNIILNINSISSNNIYFYDSVKNTIINNSNFIKITYSNNYFILNGIYIKIKLPNIGYCSIRVSFLCKYCSTFFK